MFKDEIELLKTEKVSDGGGGLVEKQESSFFVLANKKSASANEVYKAMMVDVEISKVFKISIFDYDEHRYLRHEGILYRIVRTYENGDYIELYCEKKVGKDDFLESR